MRLRPVCVLAAALLLPVVAACGPNGSGGKASTVIYKATGSGTATVEYAATAGDHLTVRHDVTLPWQVTVHPHDHSRSIYRVLVSGGSDPNCSINVNGVHVDATKQRGTDAVECAFIK